MPKSVAQECSAPTALDEHGLSTSHHRHECTVLNHVCLFNGTILPSAPGGRAEQEAVRLATTLTVRSMFGSHQKFKLSYLHPMRALEPSSPGAGLLRRAVKRDGWSPCVPLVWVPVWAFSFAEHFINSVVPVAELLEAGLIDERVLLRPDLNARPLGRYSFYRMIAALSDGSTMGLRDAAPKCRDTDAAALLSSRAEAPWRARRECVARCYARLVLCNFKSTFDPYVPPMAPWAAAQRVARRLLRRPPPPAWPPPATAADGTGGATLRVLFVNRTGTRFSRSLHNLPQLLAQCAPRAAALRSVCHAHEFGRRGVREDAAAAREADVLVGTHGAALVYSFYMAQRASLVEAAARPCTPAPPHPCARASVPSSRLCTRVPSHPRPSATQVRPYRFEGKWPDHYFRDLAQLEQTPLYFQAAPTAAPSTAPRPRGTHIRPHARRALFSSPQPSSTRPRSLAAPAAGELGQPGAEHPAAQGRRVSVGRAGPPRALAMAVAARRARGCAVGRRLGRALPAARGLRQEHLRQPAQREGASASEHSLSALGSVS